MSLHPGTRLGAYEILSAIGAGGMGEVFRARDTKLNRDVAIKVLPAAFADDPERLARFTREAQTLASLNHPNIATIHGIEEVPVTGGSGPGSRSLVMELVEGEDLSAHIARGPIPIAEALPIARQIAEALEAAHEQGIVHRDLKPGNIKVRTDGTVKVLDFGLAKAMDSASASSSNPNVSHSPTLTHQGTQAGMIIGTAAYMSPEQAKGKPVDKRADIWAFGVVLFEMLRGARLFRGEDVSDTLAAVLRQDVDFNGLPSEIPPAVRRLMMRCLDRDLKRRLRDVGEARVVLDNPNSAAVADSAAMQVAAVVLPPTPSAPRWKHALPWSLVAVMATFVVSLWSPWRQAAPPSPRRLLASIGVEASMPALSGASAVLSPDGTTLAMIAEPKGQPVQLYVRTLDQLEAAVRPGTEGATGPFFSPDGQWIGFFSGTKLMKVRTTGGTPTALTELITPRGAAWTEDNAIIFAPNRSGPLFRVSASGGTPKEFTTLSPDAKTHRWPQILPEGRGIVFTEWDNPSDLEGANIAVAPMSGGAPKVVVRDGYYGRYVPSGHLVFMRSGAFLAVPFDLKRLEVTGETTPIPESVRANPPSGAAKFDFAHDGSLVYEPGTDTFSTRPLAWLTRDGRFQELPTPVRWSSPRLSPDGTRATLIVNQKESDHVWMYDLAQGRADQLTFGQGVSCCVVWAPDGKRFVFSRALEPGAKPDLLMMRADGSGEPTLLLSGARAGSFHPDGSLLTIQRAGPGSPENTLFLLPLKGDATHGFSAGEPTVFLKTAGQAHQPVFSPDGRWIAYRSDESGETSGGLNIYVRPFPARSGAPRRVSTEGGFSPSWSRATGELLFNQGQMNKIMASRYTATGDTFSPETPKPWAAEGGFTSSSFGRVFAGYALHPDGKRVLVAVPEGEGGPPRDKLVFFFGFADYLRSLTGSGGAKP